jgi:hypothetical protein
MYCFYYEINRGQRLTVPSVTCDGNIFIYADNFVPGCEQMNNSDAAVVIKSFKIFLKGHCLKVFKKIYISHIHHNYPIIQNKVKF